MNLVPYEAQKEPAIRAVSPSEMGWHPRPDLGPRVWESPAGGLHAFAKGEQVRILMFDGLGDWQFDCEHDFSAEAIAAAEQEQALSRPPPLTINEAAHGDDLSPMLPLFGDDLCRCEQCRRDPTGW